MKQKQSILKLAALAVLIASCTDNVPDLPPPCEGYYNTETHSCYREVMPTCEGKDDCVGIGANCEITSAEEDGHTYKVICEDEFVGYLDNGKPGEKGESGLDGTNGEDCSIAETLTGVEIACTTLKLPLSHGIIGEDGKNGKDGKDGEDGEDGTNGTNGENCKIAQTDDGVKITCGKVELSLSHGTPGTTNNGTNGEHCTIAETDKGVVITCGTVETYLYHGADRDKGEKGGKGVTGNGCIIVPTDKGVEITCGGLTLTTGLLNHGKDGDPGSVITIDKDGYWCIDGKDTGIKAAGAKGEDCTVEEKGKRIEMFCGGTKVAEWPKAMLFFTDIRDGKKYAYLTIGTQTWMAENLNYATGGLCYGYLESNCDIYGRMYDWKTAMTVCPDGWHLPSEEDWDIFLDYVQTDNGETYDSGEQASIAGKYLKATSGWEYDDDEGQSGNGEDKYGFAALPCGISMWGYFYNAGNDCDWWGSSEDSEDPGSAYTRGMYYNHEFVGWYYHDKNSLLSVRCVKGAPLCGGKAYDPATQFCDSRDSKVYKKTKIDTQTWMAENLNYNAADSKCYDNLESNCDTYGRLYDWETAMAGSASSNANPSGVQGVCPSGWHLPSHAEWNALLPFVHSDNGLTSYYTSGMSTAAGKYLKAGSDDKYGFSALMGGCSSSDDDFSDYNIIYVGYKCSTPDSEFFGVGNNGKWWSSGDQRSVFGGDNNDALLWNMSSSGDNISSGNYPKDYMLSVRCVQN